LLSTPLRAEFPLELGRLENGVPKSYITSVGRLPRSAIDALRTVNGLNDFHMADAGGAWNATDIVTDQTLPFRRLIWAASLRGYVVVHYERSGYGHSYHFIVVSPENEDGKRSIAWSAISFYRADTYAEFIRNLNAGKMDVDPRWIR
jgi:hypothetical protein